MQSLDFLTIIAAVLIVAAFFHRISYFRTKKVGYFDLLQLLYLIVFPVTIYLVIFTHVQLLLATPPNGLGLFSDGILMNLFMISCMLTYGGVVMHAMGKMLSKELVGHDHLAAFKTNRFFHMTFSHNLMIAGSLAAALWLALLEINHAQLDNPADLIQSSLVGVVIGSVLWLSMYWYQKTTVEHEGRWYDLRHTFIIVWILFAVLLYYYQSLNAEAFAYSEYVVAVFVALLVLMIASLILVIRRLKNGHLGLFFSWGKESQLILETDIDADEPLKKFHSR